MTLFDIQAHRVQRLDLQEVAKLGKGNDSTAASQDVKEEEQALQGAANTQTDSKDKDSSSATGKTHQSCRFGLASFRLAQTLFKQSCLWQHVMKDHFLWSGHCCCIVTFHCSGLLYCFACDVVRQALACSPNSICKPPSKAPQTISPKLPNNPCKNYSNISS